MNARIPNLALLLAQESKCDDIEEYGRWLETAPTKREASEYFGPISTPELVAQFDRLYGADLRARRPPIVRMVDVATGKVADDMREFVHFVHQGVYLTLSDDAILSLRVEAAEP